LKRLFAVAFAWGCHDCTNPPSQAWKVAAVFSLKFRMISIPLTVRLWTIRQNPLSNHGTFWRKNCESQEKAFLPAQKAKKKYPNPAAGLVPAFLAELDEASPGVRMLDNLRNFAIYTPATSALRDYRMADHE